MCEGFMEYSKIVPLYGTLEIKCSGISDGSPFTERSIYAEISGAESKTVRGFYDGDGVYIVRFMPQTIGEYSFRICGNFSEVSEQGSFTVTEPEKDRHGMVGVSGKYHFAHADGTPYWSVGTTCYVWHLQSEETKRLTLRNFAECGFNKIRFCVFPKHYAYNLSEPPCYPYVGTPMDSSVLNMTNFNEYNGCAGGNS